MSLGLFEGFGVELEYMITDSRTGIVMPIADLLLRKHIDSPEFVSDVELPETGLGWSNELALHVVEFKTLGPEASLAPLPARFGDSVGRVNSLLEAFGARLMPSAMHPLMNPLKEMRLWPHDNGPIYSAFDRIFGTSGHGWANLQSVHLNLPFADPHEAGDDQFGRLHAAIRLLLPIMPALAASSPIMDGKLTGVADNRLAVYRTNARRVPSVSGRVIPEPIYTKDRYEGELLEGIYRDLEPLDPEGIVRFEWVNARGAIARFMRNAIEIRVLDVQECPLADLSICAAIVAVLRDIVGERWQPAENQKQWPVERLEPILTTMIHQAGTGVVTDRDYLAALGYKQDRATGSELWAHLIESCLAPAPDAPLWIPSLGVITREGTLATRLSRALGQHPAAEEIRAVYSELCDCLARGEMFRAGR
ncbi:MAG: hypothetical protein KF745_02020 [Phycisphaeraceae bacterium]|nr:hypothetical protein [Phycisphaeraceae bacterium]